MWTRPRAPGFENALFSFDPSAREAIWRTLDPGSIDPDPIGGGGTDDSEGGGVWRPRARARLGMVGAPGGLYVFGGHGTSILPWEDYIPTGPSWFENSAKYGAWEDVHTAHAPCTPAPPLARTGERCMRVGLQ